MKLHLPTLLRKALLTAIASTFVSAGAASGSVTGHNNSSYASCYTEDYYIVSAATSDRFYAAAGNTYGAVVNDYTLAYGSQGFINQVDTTNGYIISRGDLTAVGSVQTTGGADLSVAGNLTAENGDISLGGDTTYYYDSTTWTETVDGVEEPRHSHATATEYGTTNVGGTMSAKGDISLTDNDTTVGGNQLAGGDITIDAASSNEVTHNQVASGISTSGTNDIGGTQTATSGNIAVLGGTNTALAGQNASQSIMVSGTNYVGTYAGNTLGLGTGTGQNAGTNILVNAGATNTVVGGQNAGGAITANGTNDITGDQTADNLTVGANGSNSVSGNQTMSGAIVANGTNEVGGDQSASSITANANTTVGGTQTATGGDISVAAGILNTVNKGQSASQQVVVSGSNVVNAGGQDAGTNILVNAGATNTVVGGQNAGGAITANGTNDITGDQTADSLTVGANGSNSVSGNQTMSGAIVANGTNEVGGDQSASSITANANTTVGGTQTATGGDISVAAGALNTVDKGQSASQQVVVSGSNVVNAGGQDAGTNILVNAGATNTVVGGQNAGGAITANGTNDITGDQTGASLTVGANGNNSVSGNQTMSGAIVANGTNEVGGDQSASSITANANTTVGGTQTATGGDISVAAGALNTVDKGQSASQQVVVSGSNVVNAGGQDAGTNILVNAGATNTVVGGQNAGGAITVSGTNTVSTGNQVAATGDITLSGTNEVTAGSQVTMAGDIVQNGGSNSIADDQSAAHDIAMTSGMLSVAGDQVAGGSISMTTSAPSSVGSQTAGTDIRLDAAELIIGKGQSATTGHISISNGSDITLSAGDQVAGSFIETVGSELRIAEGSMIAGGADNTLTSIRVTDSVVTVAKDVIADDTYSNTEVLSTAGETVTMTVGGVLDVQNSLTLGGDGTGSLTLLGETMGAQSDDNLRNSAIHAEIVKVTVDDDHTLFTGEQAVVDIRGTESNALDMDVTGTVNAQADWTASGSNTYDGSGTQEGLLTSTANVTLMGTNEVLNGGAIHSSGEGKAITMTGVNTISTDENEVSSPLDRSAVVTTGDEAAITLTGDNTVTRADIAALGEASGIKLQGNNNITDASSIGTYGAGSSIELTGKPATESEEATVGINTVAESSVGSLGAESSILIDGRNSITDSTVEALGANSAVAITGTSLIANSSISAGALQELDTNTDASSILIEETTGEGQTRITDSDIVSAGSIKISSVGAKPVVIANTNGTTIIAHNDAHTVDNSTPFEEVSFTRPTDVAIHFNNVVLESLNTTDDKEVYAAKGSILFSGGMNEMTATELSTGSGEALYDATTDNEDANAAILMAQGAQLTMHEETHFDSKLVSKGTNALIVKDGGDTLMLDHDSQRYNGSIKVNMLTDDGSDLLITGHNAGLGKLSVVQMRDSNFHIAEAAFTNGKTVTFGTLDTSADEGSRVGDNLLANSGMVQTPDMLAAADANGMQPLMNSYTDDGNTRAGFTNIGSIITVDSSSAANVVEGTAMTLSEYTLLRVDTGLNAEGAPITDRINLSGTLDARGARVLASEAVAAAMPINTAPGINDVVFDDQTTVQFMSAGKVLSAFNEDVLYDTHYDAENGTYQRDMKDMNAWVRTTDSGAELVYSRNYRSAEGKDITQANTAEVLAGLADFHHHTEGTLQASASRFENLLDAFNYTRSEGDALRGLTSVSGVTNTIAQHSVLDSSRHHLDTLRRWITLPSCTEQPAPRVVDEDGKAPLTMATTVKEDPNSTVWATYTGGYDMIDQPTASMGGYTRSHHGVQMGYSRRMNCQLLLGLGLGYENSVSRSTGTHFHADSYFADLYGSARTGRFNHRFSAGMGIHKFGTRRGVFVLAPNGHSFSDTAYGDVEARSVNLGYELSTDFALTEKSVLSPYLALNYAYHAFNNLREHGMGDAGLNTEYEDMNQLEAALGARYAYSFGLIREQAPATFFASAELKAEFCDHQPTATTSFHAAPDSAMYVKSLRRSPFYAEVGAGLSVPFADSWTGTISGSYEFGSDRNAVNVGAGVSCEF